MQRYSVRPVVKYRCANLPVIERQPSQIGDEPPVPRRVGYSVKSPGGFLAFPVLHTLSDRHVKSIPTRSRKASRVGKKKRS